MNKLVTITNLFYFDNQKVVLKNINLQFYQSQNIAFVCDYDQQKPAKMLIELISTRLKPTDGELFFDEYDDNRLIIGFKNLENILAKNIVVKKVIETLIYSNKIGNTSEIEELIDLFKINNILQTPVCNLELKDKNIINFLLLLILKPRILLLSDIDLNGSNDLKKVVYQFVRSYIHRHNITLIVCSTDQDLISNLCDRQISFSDGHIMSDINMIQKNENTENSVANKTKTIDKINTKTQDIDTKWNDFYNAEKSPVLVESTSEDNFVDSLEQTIEQKKASLVEPSSENSFSLFDLKKMVKEELVKSTHKLEQQSNEVLSVLHNIKENIPTKKISKTDNISETVIDLEDMKNNLDIVDTYYLRNELQSQIASSNFYNLSDEIKKKIQENYASANDLILLKDPRGLYDPFNNHDIKKHKKEDESITQMIIDEELDDSWKDVENTDYQTSIFENDEEDDYDYSKFKTNKYDTDDLKFGADPIKDDIEYMPFSKKENKKKWNFFKKNKPYGEHVQYDNINEPIDIDRQQLHDIMDDLQEVGFEANSRSSTFDQHFNTKPKKTKKLNEQTTTTKLKKQTPKKKSGLNSIERKFLEALEEKKERELLKKYQKLRDS